MPELFVPGEPGWVSIRTQPAGMHNTSFFTVAQLHTLGPNFFAIAYGRHRMIMGRFHDVTVGPIRRRYIIKIPQVKTNHSRSHSTIIDAIHNSANLSPSQRRIRLEHTVGIAVSPATLRQ